MLKLILSKEARMADVLNITRLIELNRQAIMIEGDQL